MTWAFHARIGASPCLLTDWVMAWESSWQQDRLLAPWWCHSLLMVRILLVLGGGRPQSWIWMVMTVRVRYIVLFLSCWWSTALVVLLMLLVRQEGAEASEVAGKHVASRPSGSKRSRAAEVHNLSEKVHSLWGRRNLEFDFVVISCFLLVYFWVNLFWGNRGGGVESMRRWRLCRIWSQIRTRLVCVCVCVCVFSWVFEECVLFCWVGCVCDLLECLYLSRQIKLRCLMRR